LHHSNIARDIATQELIKTRCDLWIPVCMGMANETVLTHPTIAIHRDRASPVFSTIVRNCPAKCLGSGCLISRS